MTGLCYRLAKSLWVFFQTEVTGKQMWWMYRLKDIPGWKKTYQWKESQEACVSCCCLSYQTSTPFLPDTEKCIPSFWELHNCMIFIKMTYYMQVKFWSWQLCSLVWQVVLVHVGVTSLIAHIRVGRMQVALEAKTTVLPAVGMIQSEDVRELHTDCKSQCF